MSTTLSSPLVVRGLAMRHTPDRQCPPQLVRAQDSAVLVGSRQRSWGGISGVVTERRCAQGFQVELNDELDQLVVMLAEVGGRVEFRPVAGPAAPSSHARQPLSLIPASFPVRGTSDKIRFVRHLVLRLDLPALARLHGDGIQLPAAFRARLMFADPKLQRLGELFAEACAEDDAWNALYGESLSLALLACLMKADGAAPRLNRGGLAPWQLRAAIEYLEANLDGELRLQTVADRVRLSCSWFSRGFRQSTGLSPHQWLIRARVDRAQRLMLDSDQSLAEIAQDLGFCDQAHFSRIFSKMTGATPGAWRRLHRPPATFVRGLALGRPAPVSAMAR